MPALPTQSAASWSAQKLLAQASPQPPHSAQLTNIELLQEVEAIRWLKARRIRALDEHTWDVYEALHAPDYFADNDGEPPIHGAAATAARLKKLYDAVGMVSVHHVHSHEIVLQTATTASGVWAMEDQLFWTWNGRDHSLHGYGFYHETYEKRDGVWVFTTRRLRRTRETRSPGAEMPDFHDPNGTAKLNNSRNGVDAAI